VYRKGGISNAGDTNLKGGPNYRSRAVIHRYLPLKEPVVLMRIVEALLVYPDIASVEQAEAVLEKARVFLIRSISSGIIP